PGRAYSRRALPGGVQMTIEETENFGVRRRIGRVRLLARNRPMLIVVDGPRLHTDARLSQQIGKVIHLGIRDAPVLPAMREEEGRRSRMYISRRTGLGIEPVIATQVW